MTNAILIVAMTIFMEAGNESYQGKTAVATVIHNRTISRNMVPVDVCLENNQFSCWKKPKKVIYEGEDWAESMLLAEQIVTGKFKPKAKWDHFYNPEYSKPRWRNKLKSTKRIGKHIFGVMP